MNIYSTGHANWASVNQAQLSPEVFNRLAKISRKINSNADPKVFQRYELMRSECAKRGVRFLPNQVLRPIYLAAGL